MDFWQGSDDSVWDRAQRELYAAGATDGMPVTPPTPGRVARMLEHCGFDADDVVATLPPSFVSATWRDIAINAVLAGCLASYLPVVGAAVAAVADPEFNLVGIATTTGFAALVIIVNGQVIAELDLNAQANALGPGNLAKATIGRALRLTLRNVGGAKPDEFSMATLGQPAEYTCCLAEHEAANPWSPLHVERGFAADASVVTWVGVTGLIEVADAASSKPDDLAQTIAQSMLIAGLVGGSTIGLLGGGEPLLILPPEIAETFHRGDCTKAQVKAAIFERAVMPLNRLSSAVRLHLATLRSCSPDIDADAALRVARKPDDVMIVVAGGVGVKAAYMPTWSSTRAVSRAVSGIVTLRR